MMFDQSRLIRYANARPSSHALAQLGVWMAFHRRWRVPSKEELAISKWADSTFDVVENDIFRKDLDTNVAIIELAVAAGNQIVLFDSCNRKL
jgi:hypothetical protein